MPSSAEAINSPSPTSFTSAALAAPVRQQYAAGSNLVASLTSATTIQPQDGLQGMAPHRDLPSLQLENSVSFSVMLGIVIVSFVLLRRIIARSRHSPLQHLT